MRSRLSEESDVTVEHKTLRQFGVGFCVILSVVSGVFWWHGHASVATVLVAVAAVFGLTGLAAPSWLGRVYGPWMRFAEKIAWFNTRLLLAIAFYFLIAPVGVVMRLFGRDPMGRRRRREGYWYPPRGHSHGNRHFERQY